MSVCHVFTDADLNDDPLLRTEKNPNPINVTPDNTNYIR